MVLGNWLTLHLKMALRLRYDLRRTPKEGEMEIMRQTLIDMIPNVLEGKVPYKTAEAVHKVAHRVVMDKYADCKMHDRGIADEQLRASLKAMDEVAKG